jgi:hypothetical protein
MEFTKEQEDIIINCGVFGYNSEKIANVSGLELSEVKKQMKYKNSKISVLLQKGIDMADYVIDLKLFNMTKAGDIKALEKLEMRKDNRS